MNQTNVSFNRRLIALWMTSCSRPQMVALTEDGRATSTRTIWMKDPGKEWRPARQTLSPLDETFRWAAEFTVVLREKFPQLGWRLAADPTVLGLAHHELLGACREDC